LYWLQWRHVQRPGLPGSWHADCECFGGRAWRQGDETMLWLIALVLALLSVDLTTCLVVQGVVLVLNHFCTAPVPRGRTVVAQ
jgi:hypothetical protein